jgi:hypothetical protein
MSTMKLFWAIIALTLLVFLPLAANAQFGVPQTKENNNKAADATVDTTGNVETEDNPYAEMALRLQSVAPIDIQDAVDIAAVLEAAQADPDTREMIAKMKQGEEGKRLKALAKEVTAMELVYGLQKSLNELKALEGLFADPQAAARAVIEMEKEGLIEKKRVAFYKENPELLGHETRQGIYFGFVSIALAGGYLE